MKSYSLVFLFILCSFISLAQDGRMNYKFSGFVDTYHAVRSKKPYDFMSSRSRLRTELSATNGDSYFFVSLNSTYNEIIRDQTKIELREAFLQYTNACWNIKAGRQIILWGVADGLRVTDIVSPMDYSEYLARDYDDIRIPVNAFRIKYIKPDYSCELVFIPSSEFFILPVDEENPWSVTRSLRMPYRADMENTPSKTFKNSEYGGRLSFFFSGIDFSVSALHSWNKMPVFKYGYTPGKDTVLLDARYSRMNMLGADFSKPVGEFVLRGEIAGYFGELIEFFGDDAVKKNTLSYLLGIDWYAADDWTFMVQYYQKIISNYKSFMKSDKNTAYATINVSKKILRSTLSLSTYAYIDLMNKAVFDRTSVDYSLTDQIHLMIGYDLFRGDKGMLSSYKDNSEIWIKAKYCF
ncbi:MAG: hypothetical protein LKI53_00970 [Bacteroidales bacterium]|jgi:hypothetical protein|nr:hypothetical protein [Bacteroidales bacterium]